MQPIHVLLFAAMQGITELFPISSLGHGVIIPALLHWSMNRDNPSFLPLLVVLHVGTATALLLYFYKDWYALIRGTVRRPLDPGNEQAQLMGRLVTATVPAGLLGLIFEKKLRLLFGNAEIVSLVLALNGLALVLGDRLRKRTATQRLYDLSWSKTLIIGFAQALALVPGMSRSGATLVAGLGCGLDYAASARFSFLMATPIIAAAGVLEIPKLFHEGVSTDGLAVILGAGLISGLLAWGSTWFLMRWFRNHELNALTPFGLYCVIAGVTAFSWLH